MILSEQQSPNVSHAESHQHVEPAPWLLQLPLQLPVAVAPHVWNLLQFLVS